MGRRLCNNFAHISIFLIMGSVAQDYFEERHRYQVRTPSEHLNEIPKRFDVKGENAIPVFNKYLKDIQDLATKKNISIVYKVKVDTLIKSKHKNTGKLRTNKKSKKYNIPLKKKSMKLSNFEIILRKRANDFGFQQRNLDQMSTTEKQKMIYTTRQVEIGKYKPDISALKTKYAKIIRPVRNREITLETKFLP